MTRRDFVKLLRHPTLGHDALLEQDLKTSSPVLAQTPCRTRADGFPLASKKIDGSFVGQIQKSPGKNVSKNLGPDESRNQEWQKVVPTIT